MNGYGDCDERARLPMPFPNPPDLAHPRRRLVLAALAVAVIVGVTTGLRDQASLARTLGDTDDAMRLVLVRSLLHGQGWWDQNVVRLQPPMGVYMHWSRLLDGAIAALNWTLNLFLSGPAAERLTRLLWPLLWVFPAAFAALATADSLADSLPPRADGRRTTGAVLICMVFLVTNLILYIQFHPGRIDHHNVQMTLCFLALAGAVERRAPVRGAALSGLSTGIGLAIGLEALVFEAAIGAAIALRYVFDRQAARPLLTYGLCLTGAVILAYGVQTPPWRWSLSNCDALAFNSTAAASVAGLAVAGLAGSDRLTRPAARFGALALAAAAATLVYLSLDPMCVKGPFADVSPPIKRFWLAHVQEMRPWPQVLKTKPEEAVMLATPPLMAVLAMIWIGRRRSARQDPAVRLTSALLLMTMAAGFAGVRMCGYADWIAMPAIAVAGAELAAFLSGRYRWPLLISLAAASILLTPEAETTIALWIHKTGSETLKRPAAKPPPRTPADHCFETAPYRTLAAAGPPGLVLAEIDLGPFILAHTQDSALAAPYHRMSWGMIAARDVLQADADNGEAEAKARALGVRYVLECDVHRGHTDRLGMKPNSLQKRLDEDEDQPAWLERVNAPDSPLEVLRVRPPATKR